MVFPFYIDSKQCWILCEVSKKYVSNDRENIYDENFQCSKFWPHCQKDSASATNQSFCLYGKQINCQRINCTQWVIKVY